MELTQPFVQLPFTFDAVRIAEEVNRLPASAWMPHPSGMPGNSAIALVSRNGEDNDRFDGEMLATQHLKRSEYLQQVLASFNVVIGRSRLMKLAAGQEVVTHVDFNYHWHSRIRIHIPIVTAPDVTFYCADRHVHMAAGQCWTFNSWRRHRVVNASTSDRVHLVIDTGGSSAFWNTVRSMQDTGDKVGDRPAKKAPIHLAHQPGHSVRIATERYNIAPIMAPGELDGMVKSLISDFSANPRNNPALTRRYAVMLEDFVHDWREVWALHGYEQSGLPKYQKLIDRVYGALHPDRKALLTSTNQIGVNPIIVQRILIPALAPVQATAFQRALSLRS